MGYGTFRAIKSMSGDMPTFGTPSSRPQQQMAMQPQYATAGMQMPQQQPITQQYMQSGAMPMSSQAPQSQYMQGGGGSVSSPGSSVTQPYHGSPSYQNPGQDGSGGRNPYDPLPPRNPNPLPRNPIDPKRPPVFDAQKQWNSALMSMYGSGRYDDNGNYQAFNPGDYSQYLDRLGGYGAINVNRWNSVDIANQIMMLQNQPLTSWG